MDLVVSMSDYPPYPDCPECGEPVTGLAYFGAGNPPGPIGQAVPCYHRIMVATWRGAGS